MIYTNVSITVKDGKSIQDSDIYIYKGDRNIEARFTILDNPFRYTDMENLVESSNAFFAQLVIRTPNNQPAIFSEILPIEYGVAVLIITEEMIDELKEVGEYDYQIRLYDESQESRVSTPPIIGGLKVLEPIYEGR